MKTREEMNEIFADVPEALSNTVDICDQVEFYSIDHAPIMPTSQFPNRLVRKKSTGRSLGKGSWFDEFTQDDERKRRHG